MRLRYNRRMSEASTLARTGSILVLVSVVALTGCVGDRGTEGEGLAPYTLKSSDLAPNGTGAQQISSGPTGRWTGYVKRWELSGAASPLRVGTGVTARIYDPPSPDAVFDRFSGGNWTKAGDAGIGTASELLVKHTVEMDGECGYRLIFRRGNLVSVVDVETRCSYFSEKAGSARDFVVNLARRQATLLRAYPVSA